MRKLYWLQNDLRLIDNPALVEAARADSLILVYLWPELPAWCNLHGLGNQRRRFLMETLIALNNSLQPYGQRLLVMQGLPTQVLTQLMRQFDVDRLVISKTPGWYEQRSLQELADRFPEAIDIYPGNTLFQAQTLPFEAGKLPKQYTPFRRAVEALDIATTCDAPKQLPPPPTGLPEGMPLQVSGKANPGFPVLGGEEQGMSKMARWFSRDGGISTYKETRNALDGSGNFSALSPWLSCGALSVRVVAEALARFEAEHGSNESTEHFLFELLWREFFHWRALADGASLFQLHGISGRKKKLQTFDARDFARWCSGDTDYPLVNALMHQLVETGWMSNRGRQIVASCLVNELNHDWRYGAAFFEKHLLDYDVGSNYSNWQYIAGVGTDPRGGRHFNLDKQAAQYDPEERFTAAWDGYRKPQPRHVTDPADWPISIDD